MRNISDKQIQFEPMKGNSSDIYLFIRHMILLGKPDKNKKKIFVTKI